MARITVKENTVISGLAEAEAICTHCGITFTRRVAEGAEIHAGSVIAELEGSASSVLMVERTILNLMSRMSGIATATRRAVEAARAANPAVRIAGTRKTAPGLRLCDKQALNTGGADPHRMSLSDMILIKDNHVDAAGGITEAVARARKRWGSRFKIEVETRNLDEVREAVASSVDRIMLDNMDNATMKESVGIIAGRAETEASGNITLERLPSLGECGVDFVSFGELTHSVSIFDFSLKQDAIL